MLQAEDRATISVYTPTDAPGGLRNIFISHLFLHPFIKFYKMGEKKHPEGRGEK